MDFQKQQRLMLLQRLGCSLQNLVFRSLDINLDDVGRGKTALADQGVDLSDRHLDGPGRGRCRLESAARQFCHAQISHHGKIGRTVDIADRYWHQFKRQLWVQLAEQA